MKLRVPSSKSMTQRALLIAALGPQPTCILNALVCDDSQHLSAGLRALGVGVQWRGHAVTVTPAPLKPPRATIACGNAGSALRFLAAAALLVDGPITLDGNAYMRRRPIAGLADALAQLGVHPRYVGAVGCPPITLARTGPVLAAATVDGSLSSQYLSALLMVAPRLPAGLLLHVKGRVVSRPYVRMTVAMMRAAGASVRRQGDGYVVQPGGYPLIKKHFPIAVEPDWSAAAFLLVAKRLCGSRLPIAGLGDPQQSLQGDAIIVSWLKQFDAPGDNTFDLSDHPDLIAPLTAMALFAAQPTLLTGVTHARVKECDRVLVLAQQLARVGARIEVGDDRMRVFPLRRPNRVAITLCPEHDHRMAMAFGLVSLRCPHITIAEPGCVSKSFANFWVELTKLRASAT